MSRSKSRKLWALGAFVVVAVAGAALFTAETAALAPGGGPTVADINATRTVANIGDPCDCTLEDHIGIDWIGRCSPKNSKNGGLVYTEIICTETGSGPTGCQWVNYPYGNQAVCVPY